MSWAHVQGAGAQVPAPGQHTLTCNFPGAVTAGDLIVVSVVGYNPDASQSVQDAVNTTNYTLLKYNTSGGFSAWIWWFVAPSGGSASAFTITVSSPSLNDMAICIDEFSFTSGATISQDSNGGNNGTSSPASLGSSLTVTGSDLVLACVCQASWTTYTQGSGFALSPGCVAYSSGHYMGNGSEYALNVTTNSNPSMTLSGGSATAWTLAAGALVATGGTPSPSTGSGAITLGGLTVSGSASCTVPLTAGTLSLTSDSSISVGLSYGTTSGGTSPYTNQLQRSPHGLASWSNIGSTVAGATATFTDSTISAGGGYDYRVHVTDSGSLSAYSGLLNVVVPGSQHSFTTAANGNWLTTGTWSGGVVPCKPYTITGCANNGSGYVRITISSAASEWSTGDQLIITGVLGTVEANGVNQTISVVSTTQFDLVNTPFVNSYVSGGTASRNDTVTIQNNVTISSSLAIGNSPVPASGYQIYMPSGSISQTSGTVSVYGSLYTSTWTMSAGTTLNQVASNGVWYTIGMGLVCNGTSGSPCVVTCTLASGANATINGVQTASYTQFSNFVAPAANFYWGIDATSDYPSGTISITNCTFNNTSWKSYAALSTTGTFTFQNNLFTNSIPNNNDATNSGCCFAFDPTATWTGQISGNVFDTDICLYYLGAVQFGPNNFVGSNNGYGTLTEGPLTTFAGNLIRLTAAPGSPLQGAASNNYYLGTVADQNLVYCTSLAESVTDCVFENTNNASTGVGICVKYGAASGSTSVSLTNNIVLPISGTNISSGRLFALATATNVNLTAEHNTQFVGGSLGGFDICDSGSGTAGQVASIRANLFWGNSKVSNKSYKVIDAAHPTSGGTSNLASPSNVNYNASWNCYTNEPSTYTSNSYTYAGNGYQANFTAYCGANDLADQSPSFVQSNRNLAAWGGTTAGGGTATVAGALAAIAANPSLITQSVTGLLPWVRAGFMPASLAFESTGWSGDTSTTDANGNAWPGSTPGFGAMAGLIFAGSGSITLGNISVAGSGGFAAPGSGTIPLGSIVVVGSASAGSAVTSTGSGSVAFGGLNVVGAGAYKTTGLGGITLGVISPAGNGAFTAPGSGAIPLGHLTVAGSGGITTTASGSVALAALTVSGAGSYTPVGASTGSGLVTLASLTVTGAGSFATAASGSITLGPITPAGVGGFTTTASGSVALAVLVVAGSGSATGPGVTVGSGAITLGSIIVTSAADGGGIVALYLPYEFTSILIDTGNADPFFIDPEQTVLITRGLTAAD